MRSEELIGPIAYGSGSALKTKAIAVGARRSIVTAAFAVNNLVSPGKKIGSSDLVFSVVQEVPFVQRTASRSEKRMDHSRSRNSFNARISVRWSRACAER